MVCYEVHGLGLNCMQDLVLEEMRNGLDKPSVGRNLTIDIEGLVFFFAHPEQHWNGRHSLRDCGAKKGMLPCVGKSNPDLV